MRLRGHHLICPHFFRGEGYDHVFSDNLMEGIRLLEGGAIVEIIEGGDFICGKCPKLENNECHYAEGSERIIRQMDAKAIRLLGVRVGMNVTWEELAAKIPSIFATWYNEECGHCDWIAVCKKHEMFVKFSRG
ncbi:MAG: hypothetical protein A2Y62_17415 [Candidatus Fischerbacteria bacterium RBG_13_37_8]|uniref:DUF1284 domain-containing protein n=1 Tax=Candidatus Fischerbacteria bacterium RBG_13_37_8 TaxID=1817863 RepID=A0A1F5VN61_9BACT|nr:MAG: hypothetical protein A2Y62_17415 [Candidatus Fischerbacteria bacterium RBG_13_37_8]